MASKQFNQYANFGEHSRSPKINSNNQEIIILPQLGFRLRFKWEQFRPITEFGLVRHLGKERGDSDFEEAFFERSLSLVSFEPRVE